MAKGSLFWGQGRGKLGQVVMATVKGQQISRTYQASVANPKSAGQMEQRAKFANAVKFFKRSQQNLFKFAYEDKKKTESDYNAFMRHNVSLSCFLNKAQVSNADFPALANVGNRGTWVLSQGSLPEIAIEAIGDAETPTLVASIPEGRTVETVTVGDLSNALLTKYGDLLEGDLITIVTIITSVNDFDDNPIGAPIWGVVQFRIDREDINELDTLFNTQTSTTATKRPAISVAETTLSITAPSSPRHPSVMLAVIASRKSDKGLLVSPSELAINNNLYKLVAEANNYSYRKAALESWNAKTAILEGSIAEGMGD